METQGPGIRNSEDSKIPQQNSIGPGSPTLDPQRIRNEGITVLNDIAPSVFDYQNAPAATFDCVILHGLNGSPYHTWLSKDKKFYWPAELLKKIPTARVMVYGYNASNEWTLGANNVTIDNLAKRFVVDLCGYRRNDPTRPLVLVAHSLGGLIIKQALANIIRDWNSGARRANSKVGFDAYTSLAGLIFFGTPHLGSRTGKEVRVRVLKAMAGAAFYKPPSKLVKALASRSDELQVISDAFSDTTLYVQHRIDLISFHETKRIWYLGHLVVDPTSTRSGYVGESSIAITQNHFDMVKFSGKDDSTFEIVWQALKDMGEGLGKQDRSVTRLEEKSSVLNQILTFHSTAWIDRLLQNTPSPLEGTLAWIKKHPSLQRLKDRSNSHILHIKGKPGCGKTVLAAALYRDLHEYIGHRDKEALTCFFACNGRDTTRNLASHVLSSLVRQICNQSALISQRVYEASLRVHEASLESVVRSVESDEVLTPRLEKIPRALTFTNLLSLFSELISWDLFPIIIVVDGLDECEEGLDREALFQFLREIVQRRAQNAIRIIVTSRSYWDINFDLRDLPPGDSTERRSSCIDLDKVGDVKKDLREFTIVSVKDLIKKRQNYRVYEDRLEAQIFDRANEGMFLMVNLLIDLLFNLADSSPRSIDHALKTLPVTLREVYHQIWQRITLQNKDRSRQVMNWLVTAFRPLSIAELNDALAEEDTMDDATGELTTGDFISVDLEGDLQRLFGPLIRITVDTWFRNGVELPGNLSHVELVHQTVREFFLPEADSSKSGAYIPPVLHQNRHAHIARVCLSLLLPTLRILDPRTDYREVSVDLSVGTVLGTGAGVRIRPFWRYASEYARHHRQQAIKEKEDPQLIEELDNIYLRTVGSSRVRN